MKAFRSIPRAARRSHWRLVLPGIPSEGTLLQIPSSGSNLESESWPSGGCRFRTLCVAPPAEIRMCSSISKLSVRKSRKRTIVESSKVVLRSLIEVRSPGSAVHLERAVTVRHCVEQLLEFVRKQRADFVRDRRRAIKMPVPLPPVIER
jgi:hypothetical protein